MSITTDSMSPDEAGSAGDLSFLWALLIRRLWLIVLCFLAVLLLGVGYVIEARPIYTSTAVVQVMQEQQRAFTPGHNDGSEDLRGEEILRTIEQNLQGHALFESVVQDPDINRDPNFLKTFVHPGERSVPFDTLADRLKGITRVSLRRGTRLIDISVNDPIPSMAQKLAQKIVDQFILLNGATQSETSRNAMQFLLKEADGVKDSLQKSENALSIYREAMVMKDRVEDQNRIIDALQQRYRDKHPELIQARSLLADVRQKFDQEIQKVLANSKDESDYWNANNSEIDSTSNDARITSELKLVEARTNVLQREVDTESALFDNVLKQMRDADVSKESAPTEIRVVEPPELPLSPSAPDKRLILIFSAVFGALLGILLVFILNALDSSIKTAPEAEELLRLPVLGAVPKVAISKKNRGVRSPDKSEPPAGLVLVEDSGGSAAESLRSLRATLGLLGKVEDRRTILFTSAFANEGKTFVSTNYAIALAQQGLRTLLIDTDLRRPSVHTTFGLELPGGLVDHITQGIDLHQLIRPQVVENLDVLTAGTKCPSPAELLAGTGFIDTLQEVLMHYDRVVIDSSPVNLVSDTLLVAPFVQTICLVVRTAHTPRRGVIHAIGLLRRAEANPVGVILNFVPTWSGYVSYAPYGYRSKEANKYRSVYS